jgi:acetolactate decarboxylase
MLRLLLNGGIVIISLASCRSHQQPSSFEAEVKSVGAMRDVMQKGELFGRISLDTIAGKNHLYGIGPLAYLKGEILVADGRVYVATIGSDGSCSVKETFQVQSPFFVYANVERWNALTLRDTVQSIQQLESYLNEASHATPQPFAFTVKGVVESATFHVVNLPEGMEVRSSKDAQTNQKNFTLMNTNVELVGFFSTRHQGVFTHHDSFVHIHIITTDKTMSGHLDEMRLKKGTVKLLVSSRF